MKKPTLRSYIFWATVLPVIGVFNFLQAAVYMGGGRFIYSFFAGVVGFYCFYVAADNAAKAIERVRDDAIEAKRKDI